MPLHEENSKRSRQMPGIDDLMRSAQEERKTKKAGIYKKSRQKREAEITRVEATDSIAETSEASSETPAPDTEPHRGAGRPQGTRTSKLTITMKPDLRRKFKAYCAINELTASDVFEEWAKKLIETWEKEHYPL